MNMASLKTRFKFSAPLLHALTDLWSWWIAELSGMLPKSVRAALLQRVERLYLQPNGAELTTRRDTGESIQETGCYPLSATALRPEQAQELEELAERSREVVLCLPSDKVLVKTLTLPLVAEENLREVLGFEMDRQTPFTADQVYYDHLLTARNSKSSTLSLDLVVTPRQFLDELLTALEGIGFQPHQATICQEKSGQAQPVNLMPEQARKPKLDTARYLNLALGTLALVLMTGAIALPIMNKLHVIQELETRVELVTAKAEVTRRLREEVEQLSTDSLFLVEKKQATPLALEIINELTHLLPDDTWINRLDIKGLEVQIQGQSASAAALIPLIESSDQLHNPRFRSPVTRLPRTNTDRFNLSADMAKEIGS